MGIDPAVHPVGWPLRGEIVSLLDRLRKTLEDGVPGGHRPLGRAHERRLARQARRRRARTPVAASSAGAPPPRRH